MPTLRVDEYVDAPPAKVFETFADIPRAAEYVQAITEVEMLTDGDVSAGTRWRETRSMHGRRETLELALERFEPPRRYTVVADAHGAHYESVFEFAPEGTGTRVTMHFSGVAQTLPAKLLSLLTRPLLNGFRKSMSKDLADLKRAVETR